MSDAIDNNPDIAVGVNLPLSNSGNGFFSQSFTTLEDYLKKHLESKKAINSYCLIAYNNL